MFVYVYRKDSFYMNINEKKWIKIECKVRFDNQLKTLLSSLS